MRAKFFLPFFLLGILSFSIQVYATDTDGDGITDADETAAGYNPNLYTRFVYVDNARTDDSGDGLTPANAKKTFNAAITISKVSNQENVILTAAGTYSGTSNKNLSFDGNDIKIRSLNGAATTVIDLENSGRFLYLHNGETLNSWLDGFTVRNGSANDGGAVYMGSGAGLKIKNCLFENNLGVSYSGAVSVDTGITEITNCRFINNSSAWAGGLTLYKGQGSIVRDCEFIGNKTTNNSGGAIVIYDCNNGTVEITRCKFMYNQSSQSSGAIYARNGSNNSVYLTNCLFLDNKSDGYSDFSAAISTVTYMKNVTFAKTRHTTDFSCRFGASTTTTLQNCIIQGDILDQGAVTANNNCTQSDLSSYGSNNITVDPQLTWGGYIKSTSPCINAGLAAGAPADDIDGETRPSGNSVDIGCYEFKDTDSDTIPDKWETLNGLNPNNANDASITPTGNDLTNLQKFYYGCNPAVADTAGDGISDGQKAAAGYNPRLPLKVIYVDNAKSNDNGDGLSLTTAKKTIGATVDLVQNADYNNVIMIAAGTYAGTANRCLSFSGYDVRLCSIDGPATTIIDLENSDLFLDLYSFVWVEGLTICNGSSTDGGAIYIAECGLTLKNCVFDSNSANSSGGAVTVKYGGAVNILNCRFLNNSAYCGGAIWARDNLSVNIEQSEFNGNAADGYKGGAIDIESDHNYTANINRCKFLNNEAGSNCGILYLACSADTEFNVTNCLFMGNSANNGDVFTNGYVALNMINTTVVRDTEDVACDFSSATTAIVQNCIIYGTILNFGTLTANNNCSPMDLSSYGSNNITSDPQLTLGGYIKATSPCVNTGLNTGAPTEDMDGIERPAGIAADMGCYEFKDSDNDGIPDGWEIANGLNPNDPTDAALTDSNGISNLQKFYNNQAPTLPPPDPLADNDNDALPDAWEQTNFGNLNQTAAGDADGDGKSNLMEYLTGRKPTKTEVPEANDIFHLRVFTPIN